MKRTLSIVAVIVILTSGLKVSINRHFCGGQLADVKISLTGAAASCGMEQQAPVCPMHPVLEGNCCDNQISYISLDNNYYPQFFKISITAPEQLLTEVDSDGLFRIKRDDPNLSTLVFPPGDFMVSEQD